MSIRLTTPLPGTSKPPLYLPKSSIADEEGGGDVLVSGAPHGGGAHRSPGPCNAPSPCQPPPVRPFGTLRDLHCTRELGAALDN